MTHYRGLATVEMPVATGRYPTTRYGLVELEPKTGRKHQLRRHLAHLRHPIIGIANMAIYARIAAVLSILASSG
ncbi:tRNA pseudouridine synthase C [Escherichia coli]|uniref:tRNA pseudouridine synthase C n=1 Tax=Escherichia coli TaxID=562 RepID=A0A377CWZ9_ECOLX|nr:tRNA pseudouridine synthase C [Escherichia coli]